jgi:hypothetical protein
VGRTLSTIVAVALLLGLSALAVLAMPGSSAPMNASAVAAAPLAAEPDAPAAAQNYNMIAIPLDSTAQFASAALSFDSQGLAQLVGASVMQVMRWDKTRQAYDTWDPINGDGFVGGAYTITPFPLAIGGAYWLLVDSAAPPVVSFVGNVPDANTIEFTLTGSSPTCSYNEVSLPLEQAALTNSDQLADSISTTEVTQVLRWNPFAQTFDTWDPINNDGFVAGAYVTTAWDVKIGYPYVVCLSSGVNGSVWP